MNNQKRTTVQDLMKEVIYHGGLPMTRASVYQLTLKTTGSTKAADMFAFGPNTQKAPEGVKVWTLQEVKKLDKEYNIGLSKKSIKRLGL